MKYILTLSISLLIILHSSMSFSEASRSDIKNLDPDSIDPTMPSVVYHIKPKDFSIASYRQGKPSHFKLLLCRRCQEKTYPLNPEARLTFNQQIITQRELTLIALKKEFNYISLAINRRTGFIDFFDFDIVKKSEILTH
jgi:hypothetical protein